MLWLIQRDFLEGQSVQQMVDAALEPVPNPGRDADIDQVRTPPLTDHTRVPRAHIDCSKPMKTMSLFLQVNRIRLSLKAIAKNSTAFGLRQPHLERTRLCELDEAELEAGYVTQRNALGEVSVLLWAPARLCALMRSRKA